MIWKDAYDFNRQEGGGRAENRVARRKHSAGLQTQRINTMRPQRALNDGGLSEYRLESISLREWLGAYKKQKAMRKLRL